MFEIKMAISIRWNSAASRNFARFVRYMPGARNAQMLQIRMLRDLIEEEIRTHGGRPPQSIVLRGVSPEARLWELISSRLWLLLVIRKRGNWLSRLLGWSQPEVIIHRAFDRDPSLLELGIRPK